MPVFWMLFVVLATPGLDATHASPPPVSDIRYTVTINRETSAASAIGVAMTFRAGAPGPVSLSLPAWTPGSYEMDNWARFVVALRASQGGTLIGWNKTDQDTWRVDVPAAGDVTVEFAVRNDTLDTGAAGARGDLAYFNGTNVFLYPEGQGLDFPATVTIATETTWLVATGMASAGAPRTYRAESYHELVDMPFLVGRIEVDSSRIGDRWHRLATYPIGTLAGSDRVEFWNALGSAIPPMTAVFGETPWETYTTLIVFDDAYPGLSALEHQNSHLGIYASAAVGSSTLLSVTLHEIFHAWNVKRLRPQEMWPYRYDASQPTTQLWVSEGLTDYYADLAMVRAGLWDADGFYRATAAKISQVATLPPVALTDASLSTWIEPVDGTATIYYDKGSLAGLLLDILIRDATANRASLDDVMRSLYASEYRGGSGFTEAEWWAAVTRTAGGRSFDDFRDRYVTGRDVYPWTEVLPLAGLALQQVPERRAFIDVDGHQDSAGLRIDQVVPGSAAERGGLRPGDYLVRFDGATIGGIADAVRVLQARGSAPEGTVVPAVVERNGQRVELQIALGFNVLQRVAVVADPRAPPGAVRIRDGILTGRRP